MFQTVSSWSHILVKLAKLVSLIDKLPLPLPDESPTKITPAFTHTNATFCAKLACNKTDKDKAISYGSINIIFASVNYFLL